MKKVAVPLSSVFIASALAVALLGEFTPEQERNWPQWRGPHASGVAPHGNPPLKWAENKNVKWKVKIPGQGSSTPIVWGNRIFVTMAIPTGAKIKPEKTDSFGMGIIQPTRINKFALCALDRDTGEIIWKRTLKEDLPSEGIHPTNTWASNSPVTDGKHVWAYFGSQGLYCVDMKGTLIWEKDLGNMDIRFDFGEGSSPTLYKNKIILSWDHEGPSFMVTLDKNTGKELWRAERDEVTSWATPLVVEHGNGHQVITSATNRVRSYDLATGKLIWETNGMTVNPIPSPVAARGIVYVTSGFRGNKLLAIRLEGAEGNITGSDNIVWSLNRDTPYVPSPLLYGDAIYFLKSNSGILSAFDAQTGKELYSQQRVEGISNIYSSLVGAGNRVYITSREGTTVVIERGKKYKVLATNILDDEFDASMAVVGNEIYLRGKKHLYRISEN